MTFKRSTNQFGSTIYTSEDGRGVIQAYDAVPSSYRISVQRRTGNQTRIVRPRKKQRCYSVKVDGKLVERRVWRLDVAKEIATEAIEKAVV